MGYKYKQRVKVGTDEHGQAVYRWAVGQTIDELHESIFSLKAHGERKEDQPAPVSFGEYLQNWFLVYKRPKLKPKALSQYECKLKKAHFARLWAKAHCRDYSARHPDVLERAERLFQVLYARLDEHPRAGVSSCF